MHAKPDFIAFQRTAVCNNAVGFVQMREHNVKFSAAFSPLNSPIQQMGAAWDLRQLSPRFFAGILNNLIINAFRDGVIAHFPQGEERDLMSHFYQSTGKCKNRFFSSPTG